MSSSSPLLSPSLSSSRLSINREAAAQQSKTNDNFLPPINRVNINLKQNEASHVPHQSVPPLINQWPAGAATAPSLPHHLTQALPHQIGPYNQPQHGTQPYYQSVPHPYMNQQPSHNFQMTLNQGQFMVLNRMSHPPSKTASGGPGVDDVHSSESLLSPQLKTRLNEQMQIIRSKIAGHDTDASRLNELSYNFFPKKISKNSFIYLAQLILLKCCNKQQMKYIFWISVFQTFIQFPLTWKIMISASQTRK